MSTYYKAICDSHQARCDAFSIGMMGGLSPVGGSNELFAGFLVDHAGCRLRLVSEHHADYHSEHYMDVSDDVR